HSRLQRAHKKGRAEIHVHVLRDCATNKYNTVDDYPYGGGAGKVMEIATLAGCIEAFQSERASEGSIAMRPQRVTPHRSIANEHPNRQNSIILCGHYKGIDQRIRDI